jgi:tetratricopeptide (TPR) repeat protein
VDRILSLTKSFSDRLHYRGSKASLYLTICDLDKAEAEISEVIAEARVKESEGELTHYQRYTLALLLDFLGILRRDASLLTDAIARYKELLQGDEPSIQERANLLGLVGDTFRHKGDWANGRQSYLDALALKPFPVHKVFLCECLRQMGELREAADTLSSVSLEELSRSEQADYAFELAALAIETGERTRLENAKAALKVIEIPEPYFRERRDSLLLNVQEALITGRSPTLIQRTRSILSEMTRSAASYLILKPSFMGIGINVEKIFEDISNRGRGQPSSRQPDSPSSTRTRKG